jgi:hypothetical protein
MKKAVSIAVMLILLLGTVIPAATAAEDNKTIKETVTFVPAPRVVDDLKTESNTLSALRLFFPQEAFEKNVELITQVIGGDRKSITSVMKDDDPKFLFNIQLQLLPHQLRQYKKLYGDVAHQNAFSETLIDSLMNKPTSAKLDLYRKMN